MRERVRAARTIIKRAMLKEENMRARHVDGAFVSDMPRYRAP